MKEEKFCKDCVHYKQHYIKCPSGFQPLDGHCFFRGQKFIRRFDKGCEKWEMREENRAEQEKTLKEILSEMSDRLEKLIQILQDEE